MQETLNNEASCFLVDFSDDDGENATVTTPVITD